ncbi:LCP family protein [Yinghuangia soli]|uniref:LCP family protein n=1 Tax=Yinghuangia soli TaxID=2908204 RepID=A0AA41Q8I0_9ACTN|nr:LCP family protein [Yinghuangia soli]MCF2532686.1 LCP family protein [Yinghuangia soli]
MAKRRTPSGSASGDGGRAADGRGGRAAERRARRKRNRRRKVVLPLAIVGSLLLLTGVAGAFVAYRTLNGNIKTDAVKGKLSQDRPEPGNGRALNLVVIGSDSRAGANKALGGGKDEGERSDTTLLVHLSADRKRAVVMSIPRDILVTVPPCVLRSGSKSEERTRQMFNSAYELGGAACTRNTLERMTGMRIDHHIIVDFSGFKGMVDAVGGVEICLPQAVQDKTGKISLAAGQRKVGGKEALDFVRLRHDEAIGGNGSDLGRIKRQQAFIASLAKQITSSKVLLNPARLFNLADAMTKSIRADEGLDSVKALVDLARSVQGIKSSEITFVTVPVFDSPTDKNRLELIQPDAKRLFQAINTDEPISGRKPGAASAPVQAGAAPVGKPGTPAASGTAGTAGTPGTPGAPGGAQTSPPSSAAPPALPPGAVPPSQVHVKVLNGTGRPGVAREVGDELTRRGFVVESTGNAPQQAAATTIEHAPGLASQARTLAATVPNSELAPKSGAPQQVVLTIGSSYTGITPPGAPAGVAAPATSAPPLKVATRDGDQDICKAT